MHEAAEELVQDIERAITQTSTRQDHIRLTQLAHKARALADSLAAATHAA